MLKRMYDRSEIRFAVFWIVLYVLVMGSLKSTFGAGNGYTAAGLLLITAALAAFIVRHGMAARYGLRGVSEARRFLYFVPLLLIGTVNLWFGAELRYDIPHQLCAVFAMVLSGAAEELIFRGLLFRALEKRSVKRAIVISSLTFGAGHIVNLTTGAPVGDTLLQVCYAIAIGFAFAMVLFRSGSIVPCILTHSLINATAECAASGSTAAGYVQAVFLITVAGGYALYLRKTGTAAE